MGSVGRRIQCVVVRDWGKTFPHFRNRVPDMQQESEVNVVIDVRHGG